MVNFRSLESTIQAKHKEHNVLICFERFIGLYCCCCCCCWYTGSLYQRFPISGEPGIRLTGPLANPQPSCRGAAASSRDFFKGAGQRPDVQPSPLATITRAPPPTLYLRWWTHSMVRSNLVAPRLCAGAHRYPSGHECDRHYCEGHGLCNYG